MPASSTMVRDHTNLTRTPRRAGSRPTLYSFGGTATPRRASGLTLETANCRTYSIPVNSGTHGYDLTIQMPSRTAVNRVLRSGRSARIVGIPIGGRAANISLIPGNTGARTPVVGDFYLSPSYRDRIILNDETVMRAILAVVRGVGIDQVTASDLTAPPAPPTPSPTLAPRSVRRSRALGWVDNMAAFQAVYNAQTDEHPAARETLAGNFHLQRATPEHPSRTFGLEIEVDFPDSRNWGYEQNALAADLYAAGLSQDGYFHRWHYAARRNNPDGTYGYTSATDGWTVEFDRSVDDCGGARGVEVVSPILTDSAETWQNVGKVLELIKARGGRATMRTGLHVNIGAANVTATVLSRLARIWSQFDDLMVRIAHTPEIGRLHRGRGYCLPLWYMDTASAPAIRNNNGHTHVINMSHCDTPNALRLPAGSSSRLEFRVFDSTLELGRIQTYVMLCMAMVASAITETPAAVAGFTIEQGGAHVQARNGPARRLTGEAWENDTYRLRQFVDFLRLPLEAAEAVTLCYRQSRWMTS